MRKTSGILLSKGKGLFDFGMEHSFCIKRARGAYLYDFDGNKYLDFSLNSGAFILGHSHPVITRYIKNYVNKGFFYTLPSNLEFRLASLILEVHNGLFSQINFSFSRGVLFDKLLFLSGGGSLLFVGRRYNGLVGFSGVGALVYSGVFSFAAISLFVKRSHKRLSAICLDGLEFALDIYDGVFWADIKELCLFYNLKLIIDEELTGFRFSGDSSFFAFADYLILGNVIGGGFPLWGLLARGVNSFGKFEEAEYRCQPLYYIAGIETIKYLRRKECHSRLEGLISLLEEEVRGRDIVLRSVASIFYIEYRGGVDGILFNALLERGIFLDRVFPYAQFLSTAHTEHSVRYLAKVLNSL